MLNLMKKDTRTITELASILNIAHSTIREHLWKLENINKIKRIGRKGRNILWSSI